MKYYRVRSRKSSRGFTIVEMAIVIAVIAILVTVSALAYRGVQERARDTQRVTDMKNISEAIKVYAAKNGKFPRPKDGMWEYSNSNATAFIDELRTSGLVKSVPVDPLNDSRHTYRYFRYSSGVSGCNGGKDPIYILQVVNLDKNMKKAENNPGFSCGSFDWGDGQNVWYTMGGYLSG